MSLSRITFVLFKAMPFLIRALLYKFKYNNLKINPSVEIQNFGSFIYGNNCVISKDTNLGIHNEGSCVFSDKVYIGRNVEIGADDITIGFDSSIQDRCVLLGKIKIGSGVIFGPNIFISSGRHHFELNPYLPIREQDLIGTKTIPHRSVIIEDDCWIGVNCVIMPGITVGKGSIIGAGSIVTKSIEPYSVCVGNPAKVIRKRLEFVPPKELSPLIDSSYPYYYSGFSYIYLNNVRSIFVRDNEFSIALNFEEFKVVEMSFVNHSRSEILISSGISTFASFVGQNTLCVDISEKMRSENKLIFNIIDKNLLFDKLEIKEVKVK